MMWFILRMERKSMIVAAIVCQFVLLLTPPSWSSIQGGSAALPHFQRQSAYSGSRIADDVASVGDWKAQSEREHKRVYRPLLEGKGLQEPSLLFRPAPQSIPSPLPLVTVTAVQRKLLSPSSSSSNDDPLLS